MDFYALTALINACVATILGSFVYFKKQKGTANKIFGLVCFFVAIWSYSYFFWQISTTRETALFWSRNLMTGAIFITICYFHFVLKLLDKDKEKKYILIAGYLLLFFFFLANFTPFLVADVSPKLNFQFWPDAGILYFPFLLVWFFYAIYAVYLLAKAYSASTGVVKNQTRYILIGTIIGYLGGATNYPLWFNIPIPPIGNWTTALYLAIVAYAIIKYRFMDIRLVLSRGVIYVFSFVSVIFFSFFLLFLNTKLAQPISPNIATALIVIIAVLIFRPIFRFFENIASKYFYYTFYSYQSLLTDLSKELTRYLDLEHLSLLIITTLMNTIKLDRAVILMKKTGEKTYRIQKNIGFKEENGISLVKDNFLTIYLEKTQKPLVYEELFLIIKDTQKKEERGRLENLQTNMKRVEAALCLPLLIEDKIIGMIVLGNKISGEPYSTQDIELLTTLSNQASVALQNAHLYSEVKGFSKKLEQEVEKATKELKEAYEELKKLDKAKSEFISIASHQLRTPLTAIKGYISMILEGSYGQLGEKNKKPMENIYASSERLIKLVNGLLNVSRIEAGRIEINMEKLSLEEIIKEIVKELKPAAEEKNLYLKFKKTEKPLPKISLDKEKIRQVIMNITDNAIKYTEKGGITVKLQAGAQKLKIVISDTGEGISQEEASNLFTSFTRGKVGTRLWTEGAGLGLYIAKKFTEMHNGKVWIESPGKGRGSTFYIELPIK